jgi:hypothetical protein
MTEPIKWEDVEVPDDLSLAIDELGPFLPTEKEGILHSVRFAVYLVVSLVIVGAGYLMTAVPELAFLAHVPSEVYITMALSLVALTISFISSRTQRNTATPAADEEKVKAAMAVILASRKQASE